MKKFLNFMERVIKFHVKNVPKTFWVPLAVFCVALFYLLPSVVALKVIMIILLILSLASLIILLVSVGTPYLRDHCSTWFGKKKSAKKPSQKRKSTQKTAEKKEQPQTKEKPETVPKGPETEKKEGEDKKEP